MFSIIIPMDANRLEQFKNTKRMYDAMPQKKEFIIPTRSAPELRKYFKKNKLGKDVRLIPYKVKVGFNCSKALNIGVRRAKYSHVIITCPEVKPLTPVLDQFEKAIDSNMVCQVFDQREDGTISRSLVNRHYRAHPGMYFLAIFNKKDVKKINGWDEEFMKGYAYEDVDFGARWLRAKIPYWVRNDIKAVHQYHPRAETIPGGTRINRRRFEENNRLGIIKCKKGLKKL